MSVLLYGAGATGKTHTLLGPDRGSALGEQQFGLVPRLEQEEDCSWTSSTVGDCCSWPSATVGDCSCPSATMGDRPSKGEVWSGTWGGVNYSVWSL